MVLLTPGQKTAEHVLKGVRTSDSALVPQDVGNEMDQKVGEWNWHYKGHGLSLWLRRPEESFADMRALAMQAFAPGFYISQDKKDVAIILEQFQGMNLNLSSFALYDKEIQWPHACLPSSFKHLFMWLHPGKPPRVVGVKQIGGVLKCVFMFVQWGIAGPCYKRMRMSEPCGEFKLVHMDNATMSKGLMFQLHHDGDEDRTEVTYFEPVDVVPGNKIFRACADVNRTRIDLSTDLGCHYIKKWHILIMDLSTY